MGKQNHLAALVGNLADSRSRALDAGRVGHFAVLDRHVEIDAHEHALAPHVGLIERVEHVSAHCGRVRSACPSQSRLEKPHSLSYHIICTSVSSITLSATTTIEIVPEMASGGPSD